MYTELKIYSMPCYTDKFDNLIISLCMAARELKTQFTYNPHPLYFEKKAAGYSPENTVNEALGTHRLRTWSSWTWRLVSCCVNSSLDLHILLQAVVCVSSCKGHAGDEVASEERLKGSEEMIHSLRSRSKSGARGRREGCGHASSGWRSD